MNFYLFVIRVQYAQTVRFFHLDRAMFIHLCCTLGFFFVDMTELFRVNEILFDLRIYF